MADLITERNRISGGLRSIVAAATTTALHTISTGKTARIKKIMIQSRQLANITVEIGYDNLGAAWTPVMPLIFVPPGVDLEMREDDIPIAGNTPDGWHADTTPVTGFAGVIAARASASAAAPNDVKMLIEVEEF